MSIPSRKCFLDARAVEGWAGNSHRSLPRPPQGRTPAIVHFVQQCGVRQASTRVGSTRSYVSGCRRETRRKLALNTFIITGDANRWKDRAFLKRIVVANYGGCFPLPIAPCLLCRQPSHWSFFISVLAPVHQTSRESPRGDSGGSRFLAQYARSRYNGCF